MKAYATVAALMIPFMVVQLADVATTPWELIGNLGFPAAVAAFVLLRLEPRVERLTLAIQQLTVQMARREATDGKHDPTA